jgi:hypothetical protein
MKTYFRIYQRCDLYRVAVRPWFWPLYTWAENRDYSTLERAVAAREILQLRSMPWKPVIEVEPLDEGI